MFRVLRDRLYATFPDGLPGAIRTGATAAASPAAAKPTAFEVDASVLGSEEVPAWLEEHVSSERMGLALDGTSIGGIWWGDRHRDRRP